MQATSIQEKMKPDYDSYSEKEMSEDFYERLKILEELDRVAENSSDEEEHEHDDEEEEEEEFSFASGEGEDAAAIAADDAFSNGQIKTVFPLFDQSLLYSGDHELQESLPMRPPVKKVFVETKEKMSSNHPVTSSSPVNDEIAGPYCDWSSRKAVEASSEACKKSNSTGFSKIWRLKELTARSNSDGRDAFVFLNGSHAPPHQPPPPPAAAKTSGKVVKKSGKGKTAAASAHEVYLRSKAKEEERRRSYLPYRPELLGFFTNVNGGLTRNVHPF